MNFSEQFVVLINDLRRNMLMYSIGEVIDGKYKVVDVCSDAGGMGTILHVESIKKEYPYSKGMGSSLRLTQVVN